MFELIDRQVLEKKIVEIPITYISRHVKIISVTIKNILK